MPKQSKRLPGWHLGQIGLPPRRAYFQRSSIIVSGRDGPMLFVRRDDGLHYVGTFANLTDAAFAAGLVNPGE